jgi:isoquinoline 1-oxidoreductase beta subunit
MYSNSTDTFDIAANCQKAFKPSCTKRKRAQNIADAELPRRSFLKVATAGGFALGAFPLLTQAQTMARPGHPPHPA